MQGTARLLLLFLNGQPVHIVDQRLKGADFATDFLIARGLTGLFLQAFYLIMQLYFYIGQPFKVMFGGA